MQRFYSARRSSYVEMTGPGYSKSYLVLREYFAYTGINFECKRIYDNLFPGSGTGLFFSAAPLRRF